MKVPERVSPPALAVETMATGQRRAGREESAMNRPNRTRATAALGLALTLGSAGGVWNVAAASAAPAPTFSQCDCGKDDGHTHAPGSEHEGMAGMDHEGMAGMDHEGMAGMDHGSDHGTGHENMPGMDHGAGHSGHGMDSAPVDRPLGLALGGFGTLNGAAMVGAFVLRRRRADVQERRREARRLAGDARRGNAGPEDRP